MSPSIETIAPNVDVAPFRAADAATMQLSTQAADSLRHVDLAKTLRQYETGGPGWTLRVNGEIVGCAGVMIPWPGVGHAWLLPSPLLPRYPMTVIRTVVEKFRDLIAAQGLVRVDCEVQAGFLPGHRFARALGFVPFGPVKERWGPNDDDYQPYVILTPRQPDVA